MSTTGTPNAAAPTARELRRQVKQWRRGRASLTWGELISEAYVVLFTAIVALAMAVNVLLEFASQADRACDGACAHVRDLGPWLLLPVLAVITLALARLVGPVVSPPAANGWLISTPVDRSALLRPAWRWALVASVVGTGLPLGVTLLLAGTPAGEAALAVVVGVGTALTCTALAASSQIGSTAAARRTTWLVAAFGVAVLALVPAGHGTLLAAPSTPVAAALAVLAVALASVLVLRVRRRLGDATRRTLGANAGLPAALSGSLAALDFGLTYDVLLARRWSGEAVVRSRTGGPTGWWALVHRDVLRAVRSPQDVAVLAAAVLVPYAVAAADVGRAVVLVTALVGFLVGPALCAGLRVVSRTRSLVSMLPMSGASVRLAHLVVPGSALLLFGLASVGTLSGEVPAVQAWWIALAAGFSALAATVRWTCAKPPEYTAPMLGTPVGALPPGVMGALFRGVDILVLTAVPLLVPDWGVWVSLALSGVVLTYLVNRD